MSWYEAAQMVNWLNTSTGHQAAYNFTGTQGTSDYAFATWTEAEAAGGTNLYRHKDAFYFLPTEDEWVKAAYWNGTSIQSYATPDGTLPIEDVDANYDFKDEGGVQPWNVGSGSEELNGTFDMMGNIQEWLESPWSEAWGDTSSVYTRGGSFFDGSDYLAASGRLHQASWGEDSRIGFRVASAPNAVPEPSTIIIWAILGTIGIGWWRRR